MTEFGGVNVDGAINSQLQGKNYVKSAGLQSNKDSGKSVTFDPVKQVFYQQALDNEYTGWDMSRPYDYIPIARYHADAEKKEERFESITHEIFRQAERAVRSGDISSTSLGNITVIQLLDEVIRREWRDFFAINGVRKIPVPKLQLDVPITDKFIANKEVPELVEADLQRNVFTQAQLRLFKNVVPIYESDETRLKATIEPMSFEIDQTSGALAQAANEQIITVIEAATDRSNGANWATINGTHGRSANNPLTGLTADLTTLLGNHFRPNTLLMDPTDASNYLSNTFINGQMDAMDRKGVGVYPLPKMPGIEAVVDVGVTAGTAVLYDRRAMLYGEGPTVAEQFRDPHRGADGWIIRQWLHPLRATNDAFARETSLQ